MIRGDMSRRGFARLLGVGGAAWPLFPDVRTSVIGHTGITWGNDTEQAVRDLSGLGYRGFETFASTLESWEPRGGLRRILLEHRLPLISGYCTVNLTDSTKKAAELRKLARAGGLIARNGGRIAVLGPNGVTRSGFDFASHKANIVAMLNECGNILGYCPLGQGRVDIPAVLNLAANANMKGMVMVELDPSPNMPATPGDTARIGKVYLERLGYTFKTQEEQP